MGTLINSFIEANFSGSTVTNYAQAADWGVETQNRTAKTINVVRYFNFAIIVLNSFIMSCIIFKN